MSKVIVIGGGPSGAFASYFAALNGHEVVLLEKNEKLGKKLYITGKGRCNITNASDMEVLFQNVMSNQKFLYSAFYSFTNDQVLDFFHSQGLKTKVERGNRVFPESDHSSDVIAALYQALEQVDVQIRLHTTVCEVIKQSNGFLVETYNKDRFTCDVVVIATGGKSYSATGSTGDGYTFAKNLGHSITQLTPSLVPFNIKENWIKELQGLSLKNSAITILDNKKVLYQDFGEMLFTHFGVSGPMILSASAAINPQYFKKDLLLSIDLKPALTEEQLDKRILREFEAATNKQIKNVLGKLLPSKMIPCMIRKSGMNPDKKVNEISKEERLCLLHNIKHFEITVSGLRGWNEAIITKGGVSVKDINPSTMESKLIPNLFFCGEVLDLDAMTGGYNLQIAWSTGYLAGSNIS